MTKTVSKVRKFLPPVVVGSVVTAIGFVAARIAVQWTFSKQEPLYLILALISFLLALVLKFKTKGIISQGFILVTVVIVGVVVSSFLGIFDWEAVHAAPWLRIPRLFPFTGMKGQPSGAITIIAAAVIGGFSGYMGAIFESVGDLSLIHI